jgi:hypothetical protein
LPTARLTTKPARVGPLDAPAPGRPGVRRWTTRVSPPLRRPRRETRRRSSPRLRRCGAGNTGRAEARTGGHEVGRAGRLRPRDSCGPCGDARTGWSDRHGCACAAGIRAPCGDAGCSAGTYAWSRVLSDGSGTDHAVAPVDLPWTDDGMDRRHPSTPGDRETVRAGDPAGQIPPVRRHAARVRMWISVAHPTPLSGFAQAFGNLWIAPCPAPARGVMFGPRRVSPRSPQPFPAALSVPSAEASEEGSDLR